ncbi:hypothetical protein DICPUDRAFT_154354 [Dictyostelium purpureum]|uniref:Uncharacterized protein n=1 Tax=Dictyostelium purpureum TaxID=5786 RepID=F0ZR49_DICPU|nr:uncharacterized protein DICPUDRAFT_154354 [Dictyostelium purpureum]EGC33586.1 hypothetical protein DICPUDRAFT_154354 [Dictyostelium purpureum]|eukprot:XP_003289901.1 hypothetical protein DICPUDRAFT_154354 [Dictyostelium purpureum]
MYTNKKLSFILLFLICFNNFHNVFCGGGDDSNVLSYLDSTDSEKKWETDENGFKYLQAYTDSNKCYTLSFNAYHSLVSKATRIEMENTTIIDWNTRRAYQWPGIELSMDMSNNEYYKPNEQEIALYSQYNDFDNEDFLLKDIISREFITNINFTTGIDLINGIVCKKVIGYCSRETIYTNLTCSRECYINQIDMDGNLEFKNVTRDVINLGNVTDQRALNNYYDDLVEIDQKSIKKFFINSSEWLTLLFFVSSDEKYAKWVEIGVTKDDEKINNNIVVSSYEKLDINPATYFNTPFIFNPGNYCQELVPSIRSQVLDFSKQLSSAETPQFPFLNFNGSFDFFLTDEDSDELEWGFDSSSGFEYIVKDNSIITTINHRDYNSFQADLNTGNCKDIVTPANRTRSLYVNQDLQKIFMPSLFNENLNWTFSNKTLYRGINVEKWSSSIGSIYFAQNGWGFPGRTFNYKPDQSLLIPVGIKLFSLSNDFIPIYLFSFVTKSEKHELFDFNIKKCFPTLPPFYTTMVSINSNINGVTLQYNETYTMDMDRNNVLVSESKYGGDYQYLYSWNPHIFISANNDSCQKFQNPKNLTLLNDVSTILDSIGFVKSVSFFYTQLRVEKEVSQSYIGKVNHRGRDIHQWRIKSGTKQMSNPFFNKNGYNTNLTADLYYELFPSKLNNLTFTMTPSTVVLNFTFTSNNSIPINNVITIDYILFNTLQGIYEISFRNTYNCNDKKNPSFNCTKDYQKIERNSTSLIPEKFHSIIEFRNQFSNVSIPPFILQWDHNGQYKNDIISSFNFQTKRTQYILNNQSNIKHFNNDSIPPNETNYKESQIFKFLIGLDKNNNSYNLNYNKKDQISYKGVPVDVASYTISNNQTLEIYYYPKDWDVRSFSILNNNEKVPMSISFYEKNELKEHLDFIIFGNLKQLINKNDTSSSQSKNEKDAKNSNSGSKKDKSLSVGGIVGIIVASVVIVSVLVGLSVFYVYRRKHRRNNSNEGKAVLLEDRVLSDSSNTINSPNNNAII